MAGMIDVEMQLEIEMRKTPITNVPLRERIQSFRVIAQRMDIPVSVQGAIVGCERRAQSLVDGPHGGLCRLQKSEKTGRGGRLVLYSLACHLDFGEIA